MDKYGDPARSGFHEGLRDLFSFFGGQLQRFPVGQQGQKPELKDKKHFAALNL
jgi:hypothetical protein